MKEVEMKQHRIESWLAATLMLAFPLAALAQSGASSGQNPLVGGSTSGLSNAQAAIQSTSPSDQASAEADAKAKAEAQLEIDNILARGAKTSAKTRADVDAKLAATTHKVDDAASTAGDAAVAQRLAADFGMSSDAILAEKQTLGASWGQLMIAQTLASNSSSGLGVEQIYQMRTDGNGWGQIAAGMGLKLGDLVSATQAEGKVAAGLEKPQGKAPQIHAATVSTRSASHVGANAAGAKVGTNVGANVDVKVKPGKP
jgi:hypothetical protein